MTTTKGVKNNFLASLLSNQGNQNFQSTIQTEESQSRTRNKTEVGLSASLTHDFFTQQAMRIFDGQEKTEDVRFIPGFHNLDRGIAQALIPAYKNGCPIARYQLLEIERLLDLAISNIKLDHEEASRQLTVFSNTNPNYKVHQRTNAIIGERTISFRSPHIRHLTQSLADVDRTLLIYDILITVDPKNKSTYASSKRAVSGNIRTPLMEFSRYKNTGATIKDFSEMNSRAVESIKANDRIKLPEDFDAWWKECDLESQFLGLPPSLESFVKDREEATEQALVEAEEHEAEALAERRSEAVIQP
ncbi:AcaB family transcriptional regulator [Vibrio lentus]|uniref:AcaB family transcriptional regulator n=1 Tax=Vibrio splendidus TaxID=29497 RepID=UPI000C85493C|nr:AcaB family transcriptional regulator [Vibrio splendidus]PMG17868.1 hypothetical protein BCU98_00615 [Vibrio splendidus]